FERCEFMINNALSGVEPFRFNAVFCNPPFHQKHALTDNIAWERKFGGQLNAERIALLAMYHDASEVLTGDLPTPVKYFNSQIAQ
ncbi:methyltransferase, partial [Salmonella enterica subsp. enterica serovar Kentucky]|nr:methyltransferase [Salmonella enterica subsp. enterica serovar Kentucky]